MCGAGFTDDNFPQGWGEGVIGTVGIAFPTCSVLEMQLHSGYAWGMTAHLPVKVE